MFLVANHRSSGRTFNPSTLPSTASLQVSKSGYAPRINPPQRQYGLESVSPIAVGQEGNAPGASSTARSNYEDKLLDNSTLSANTFSDHTSNLLPDGTAIASESAPNHVAVYEKQPFKRTEDLRSPSGGEKTTLGHEVLTETNFLPSEEILPLPDDVTSLPPQATGVGGVEQKPESMGRTKEPSGEVYEDQSHKEDMKQDHDREHMTFHSPSTRRDVGALERPSYDVDLGHPLEDGHRPDDDGPGSDPTSDSQAASSVGIRAKSQRSVIDEELELVKLDSTHSPKLLPRSDEREADSSESSSLLPPATTDFVSDNVMSETVAEQVSDESNAVSARRENTIQNEQTGAILKSTSGMRDHVFPGMHGDSSRELTLSRRPPMRIDTGVLSTDEARRIDANTEIAKAIPTPSDVATPSRQAPVSSAAHSPPERMTTRVSSGALRHKSVSEILGETPRVTSSNVDKSPSVREYGDSQNDEPRFLQTPKSASSLTSPDPVAFKRRLSELKEKERSKLSTVVFSSSHNPDIVKAQSLEEQRDARFDRDYMLTLFNFQVASPPRAHTLNALIKGAHKTLTTTDQLVDFSERQTCRMLNKIYELQARNSWSFRQIERSTEPPRPSTHWDVLLGEMKWLRTDFREERKWKLAAAKHLAHACAEWAATSLDQRKLLQVKAHLQSAVKNAKSMSSTPDLVHSPDDNTSDGTDDNSILDPRNPPAAIFSMPPDMFVFGLDRSPVSDKLMQELPLYQPNFDIQNAALGITELDPNASWKKSLVPVSKYAQGKLMSTSTSENKSVSRDQGPLRKRPRLDYYLEDKRAGTPGLNPDNDSEKQLEPEQNDVALFDPEHKHIRDRIHGGHAFRPPSEYPMPSESFFVARQSSQWTPAEDDELRRNVKDFSYNWSLISSASTLPSKFASGAERRTPWECFERWIGLEGLPVDMAKINYFRAYLSRIQSAAQKTAEAQQAAQQSQGNTAQPQRRRTTQPYTVERRKDQKHFHLIDAMRKLAKKRETALNKQQHGMFSRI